MITTVILDGAMGKKFGKKWELYVDSPAAALRLIEANKPGMTAWIRDNLTKYEGYEVTCEYSNGVVEVVGEEELTMNGELKLIRFTPVLTGTGNVAKIIAGVIIIAIVTWLTWGTGTAATAGLFGTAFMGGVGAGSMAVGAMMMGASLIIGGVVGMMTAQPTFGGDDTSSRVDKTSYYFNGPSNTSMQGVPVPLIYGRCLVGSHPISVVLTVDESTV